MTESTPPSDWIAARTPTPPEALVSRLQAMLAEHDGDADTSDTLLASAQRAMATLLRDGCVTRESALDLLAVDALVTYAFEAAADDPARLEDRAKQTLARIAALAKPPSA